MTQLANGTIPSFGSIRVVIVVSPLVVQTVHLRLAQQNHA